MTSVFLSHTHEAACRRSEALVLGGGGGGGCRTIKQTKKSVINECTKNDFAFFLMHSSPKQKQSQKHLLFWPGKNLKINYLIIPS